MGAGTNRMNVYTVSMATQGLANYINRTVTDAEKSIAIAYDCRINSPLFAETAAKVMAANGIKAYLFEELRPTPELSFAVRQLGCTAGIVITASHNPKEYNGYKVYWNDGAQIIDPHDKLIIEEVRKIKSPADVKTDGDKNLIVDIGEEMDDLYQKTLMKEIINPEVIKAQHEMEIVYTSIHGTGITQIPSMLTELGFTNVNIVSEQADPDGEFPTVESPNPEEQPALALALELGEKMEAEIILGTDPDADRVGIAVKDLDGKYVLLNGNETGAMLTYYLLSQRKEKGTLPANGFVCSTIVTTELIDRIADKFNIPCYTTLTGFKHIAAVIRKKEGQEKFIGGGEESYGYMIGDNVRDKDAVMTSVVLCEIAAWAKSKGSSFYQELINMYIDLGLYREALVSLVKKGRDGAEIISSIMDGYRNNTPTSIAGSDVVEMRDFLSGEIKNFKDGTTGKTTVPKSNVIQFYLADGSKITARPSGTEPKIKYYFSLHADIDSNETFVEMRDKLNRRIEELKAAFVQG
jgi:phosphoglucomutase